MSTTHPVRLRREELGLSLNELAKRAKLAKSTISTFESGKKQHVAQTTAQKLASALGSSIGQLFKPHEVINKSNKALQNYMHRPNDRICKDCHLAIPTIEQECPDCA